MDYGEPEGFNEDFIKYFIKDVIVSKEKKIEIIWNFGLNELLEMEENVWARQTKTQKNFS